jgi:hypothetical protein
MVTANEPLEISLKFGTGQIKRIPIHYALNISKSVQKQKWKQCKT